MAPNTISPPVGSGFVYDVVPGIGTVTPVGPLTEASVNVYLPVISILSSPITSRIFSTGI